MFQLPSLPREDPFVTWICLGQGMKMRKFMLCFWDVGDFIRWWHETNSRHADDRPDYAGAVEKIVV